MSTCYKGKCRKCCNVSVKALTWYFCFSVASSQWEIDQLADQGGIGIFLISLSQQAVRNSQQTVTFTRPVHGGNFDHYSATSCSLKSSKNVTGGHFLFPWIGVCFKENGKARWAHAVAWTVMLHITRLLLPEHYPKITVGWHYTSLICLCWSSS